MRIRGNTGSLAHTGEDRSQCFMLSRILLYMDRLLARLSRLDYEILEIIHWLLGVEIVEADLLCVASMLVSGQRKRPCEAEIRDEIRHRRDFASFMDEALRRATKEEYQCVVGLLRELLKKRLDQLQCSGDSEIEKSLGVFKQMFDLCELETEICLFLFILSAYEEARDVFEYHLKADRFAGRTLLAIMLGCNSSDIGEALKGKLSKIGVLDPDSRTLCMDSGFVDLLQNGVSEEIKTEFFRKIDPDPVALEAHALDPEIMDHLLNILKAKPLSSTHIILHGPPGTGKTSLALGLGKKLRLPIYLVEHGGKGKGWKRQASFTASVTMASQGEGALVIADDADLILGTRHSWLFFGETSDKRWLHDILEVPGVRMIWTVNSIAGLEESVARRFSFSLAFKPFGRVQRKRLWETILTDYCLDSHFSNSDMEDLAAEYDVSAGVIEQSVKKAAEMGSDAKDEIHKAVTLCLEAHQSLINGGRKPLRASTIDSESVALEGLNVSGADLPVLLKELEAFSDYLKRSRSDEPISMSLLFYGISGSGKSFLARFIGHHLDREVLIKRASDLLSPWVGETEHNIRQAFDEAAEKGAILLVDEIDFLGSRDRATHRWEISQINEFLTAMESFRGIQIYTSNLLTHLDPATLRRFNHKVEFHSLRPEGIVVFYRKLLVPLVGSDLDKKLERELKGISGLTPGDIRVVRDQFRFKARENISHRALVEALREEARVRDIHAGKKAIGF